MGLSQEYQKRIKELDVSAGGRLKALADKAASVNAPVLIIGLGGSGMDSLLATKKMIYDTIEGEKKDGKFADKPRNIEYLGIDTDEGYRNKSYQGIRLNESAGEIQIYTMPNVQPVLANPELLPPYVNKWLDCTMEQASVTNGAGAVRQLGRLLLMQNIAKVKSILETKIKKVTTGFAADIPLYVFIISGISGGTGSGTFIDIPYIVRAISETMSTRPVQNIGFLFMPDVNANKAGINGVAVNSLYTNGFASLKELDYLMNIEHSGDSFEQVYGDLVVGSKAGKPVKPYDICLLLSSKNRSGALVKVGNEGYELITHVVAETILNFVLEDKGASDFNGFSINSWLSNENRNMLTYKNTMGDHRRPVSYVYSIAGASSAKLPIDDVMSYLAYKMYEQVQNLWDNEPKPQDIDEIEQYFHLGKKVIISEAQAKLPSANAASLTPAMVTQNHPQVVQMYEAAFKKQQIQIVANLEAMLDKLEVSVDDPANIVSQYFKDFNRGPVFAQRCLLTGNPSKERRSVITDIRQYKLDFVGEGPSVEDMERMERMIPIALDELRHPGLFGKNEKFQKYVSTMNQFYRAKMLQFMYVQLQTFCRRAESILLSKNNEIFEIVSDLLRQMMPIFKNYGDIKSATSTKVDARGTTLSWQMISTPDFIKELEARMATNEEFSVNLQDTVQHFYSYLFDHVDMWKDEGENGVEQMNSFIYKEFNVILDHAMDFFLEIIANSKNMTLQEYCDGILRDLTEKAEVCYPIDSAFAVGAVEQPSYSFISVPNNSPNLLAAAQNTAKHTATAGGAQSIVKSSGVKDRIFMMNFMSATPLSLNADIKTFYQKYMGQRDGTKGLHLYVPTEVAKQKSDTDWRDLPSPYPESEWVGFSDDREKIVNDRYREVLNKALEYGYAVEDTLARTLTLYYGSPIDCDAVAAEFSIDLKSDANIKKRDAQMFIKRMGELMEKDSIPSACKETLECTNMVLDIDGTMKKSYEDITFIQLYKPRDAVRAMVESYEAAKAAIQNVKSRVVNDTIVETFVKCRLTGEVNRHPKKLGSYVYFDRDRAAHELLTLNANQGQYPEYYILKAFMELPEQSRKVLEMNATNALNSGEKTDEYLKRLKVYVAKTIEEKIEALNWDFEEIENGEKILESYKQLKVMAGRLESILKPAFDDMDDIF